MNYNIYTGFLVNDMTLFYCIIHNFCFLYAKNELPIIPFPDFRHGSYYYFIHMWHKLYIRNRLQEVKVAKVEIKTCLFVNRFQTTWKRVWV